MKYVHLKYDDDKSELFLQPLLPKLYTYYAFQHFHTTLPVATILHKK